MTERASIFTGVQLGVEVTSGEAVAADKKLGSLGIEPSVAAEIDSFRPMGNKYPTLAALNKEWVKAKLSGKLVYSEVIYPLSSLCDGGSVSGLGGSPAAYSWVFTSDSDGADTPKTFTVEQGDATRAHRFANGLVTGLKFNFSRDEVGISGDMLGMRLEDGITMTAEPTAIDLIPVLPSQVDIYADDSAATLGNTQLTRVLGFEWELNGRFGPLWALNSSNTSFATTVETEPKITAKLRMEADSVGMGLLTTMRAGSTKFVRIKGTGDTISGANKYLMQIDTALKVVDVSDFSDEDGVFAIEWTLEGMHDSTWTKAFNITVINKQSAL